VATDHPPPHGPQGRSKLEWTPLQPRNGSELTDDAYLIARLALDSLLLCQRREPLGVHVRDRLNRDCGVAQVCVDSIAER
jgi:hypothetical protein